MGVVRKYETIVKCYQRKKSQQYLITLKGEHGFKPDEPVFIIPVDDLEDLENISNSRNKQISDLETQIKDTARDHEKELFLKDTRISELEKLELEDYQGKYNKLRNRYDHLQERLNKSLEEVNKQQKVITDLSNRGFLDYITGRLPESFKQLQGPIEKK